MILIGIDLAWNGEVNPSAISVGKLVGKSLNLTHIYPSIIGLDSLMLIVKSEKRADGIAIDASLIINNKTGFRKSEIELNKQYRKKWAGCHPTNLNLYPDAFSVKLSKKLEKVGFEYFGENRWQIECYPHVSLIEIFNLEKRLAYKKGNVEAKKQGQKDLANYLLSLDSREDLQLQIPNQFKSQYLNLQFIDQLKGQALKMNEDVLDSLICLYTAGLYAINHKGKIYGNKNDGAVWVP
jgi:predicted RNase H-like nuclease